MSINFFNVSPGNGLFNILLKIFSCQGDVNTSRGTTIPNDITAIINQYNLVSQNPTLAATIAQLNQSGASSYQSGASGFQSILQTFAQQYLIAVTNLDNPQPDNSLTTALKECIRQMKLQGVFLKKSTVTLSAAAGGSNNGDGVCVTTTKRGDGLVQENTIAETILGVCQATSLTGAFQFLGQQAAAAGAFSLGQDFPAGSGCTKSITPVDANVATSLLKNGGMETWTNANIPDNWLLSVGTIGTQTKQTIVDVQTLTITGASTSGAYQLQYTNAAGKAQTTSPLAFNATASQVQAALRALTGLSAVTVSATGASPDFTHTVTYLGAGGTQTLLAVVNNSTGLTITPTHTTSGTAQVLAGSYALEILGDGATLTTIQQQLSGLAPDTPYAVSLFAICDSVPAAGTIIVDLVDGIGGSVINDDQGVANSISFSATALTTSWQHLKALQTGECAFRTPAVLPPLQFLRIRQSVAISNGKNMFLDNVQLSPFTELYSGGPFVAMFSGGKTFAAGDTITLTTTNDRAGKTREYSNRNLNMAANELIFPTSAAWTVPNPS